MQALGAETKTLPNPIDRAAFRGLMRNFPGSVTVVATAVAGRRNGLTASAVCSLTDMPPTVIVCVNREASAHDMIVESGVFSVNALSQDQAEIAQVFSGSGGLRGEIRFGSGTWSKGVTGAPVLASSVSYLECRLSEYLRASSHSVFFGHVIAGATVPEASPLLYWRGSYVGVGSDVFETLRISNIEKN